jgi:hypothetical protein
VTSLDVVVARSTSASLRDTIDALRRRYTISHVFTPATSIEAASLTVGGLRIEVRPVGGRLTVEITAEPTGNARGPPV